jgi:class 3 adenylate cyclase
MGRGVAVVLFTDLVGSTELRGRLGEEAAEDLGRRHDQALTEAVEATNGRLGSRDWPTGSWPPSPGQRWLVAGR